MIDWCRVELPPETGAVPGQLKLPPGTGAFPGQPELPPGTGAFPGQMTLWFAGKDRLAPARAAN